MAKNPQKSQHTGKITIVEEKSLLYNKNPNKY